MQAYTLLVVGSSKGSVLLDCTIWLRCASRKYHHGLLDVQILTHKFPAIELNNGKEAHMPPKL